MEIVIDIPEMLYEKIQNRKADKRTLETVILRGKSLPNGHGRLIDADALVNSLDASDRDIYCKAVIEEDAPTIIEGSDSE